MMSLEKAMQEWDSGQKENALLGINELIRRSPRELYLHITLVKWLLQLDRKAEALEALSFAWRKTREPRIADLLAELAPVVTSDLEQQTNFDQQLIKRLANILKTLSEETGLKIDVLNSSIFGVQVLESRYLKLAKDAGLLKNPPVPTIYLSPAPVNSALAKMLSREVPLVIDNSLPSISKYCSYNWESGRYQFNPDDYRKLMFGKHARLFDDWLQITGGNTNLDILEHVQDTDKFFNQNSTLEFSREEMERGQHFLQTVFDWSDTAWFVCVFARDGEYYGETEDSPGWFRNGRIETFIPSINAIIEQGGHVIRVGAKVKDKLEIDHPHFFDYSNSDHRTPFLDLYLIAHAKFFIGTPSGLCHAALLFKTPQLNVNTVNLINDSSVDLYIPKKVTFSDGSLIPFGFFLDLFYKYGTVSEFWENGIAQRQKLGITYQDNSAQEILSATLEMLNRIDGNYKDSPLADTARKGLRKLLQNRSQFLHDPRVIDTQIAGSFLETHPQLFLSNIRTRLERPSGQVAATPK